MAAMGGVNMEAKAQVPPPAVAPAFTHRWRLRRVLPQQFGKLCRIVPQDYSKRPGWKAGHAQAWSKVTVEFQDGTTVEAHRAALVPASQGRMPARCKAVECTKSIHGRGYCTSHYRVFIRKPQD